jgi:uncharacterized protein YecT (DUF1311 family)
MSHQIVPSLVIAATALLCAISPVSARPVHGYEKIRHELMQTAHFRQDDEAMHASYDRLLKILPSERSTELKKTQSHWIKDLDGRLAREADPQECVRSETLKRKEELEGMLALAQNGEQFLVGKWEFLVGKYHTVYEFRLNGTVRNKRGASGKWWFDPAHNWLILQWPDGEPTASPVHPRARDHIALDNFLSRNEVDLYRMK